MLYCKEIFSLLFFHCNTSTNVHALVIAFILVYHVGVQRSLAATAMVKHTCHGANHHFHYETDSRKSKAWTIDFGRTGTKPASYVTNVVTTTVLSDTIQIIWPLLLMRLVENKMTVRIRSFVYLFRITRQAMSMLLHSHLFQFVNLSV